MKIPHSKVLHIVGPKNSGKTTLVTFLINELSVRGFRIGAYKHSSHQHPLDKVGSDSDQLRNAGARPSAFATAEGLALFLNATEQKDEQALLKFAYRNCDLVLVESFRSAAGKKIAIVNDQKEIKDLDGVIAVINEKGKIGTFRLFKFRSPELVDFIIQYFQLKM